MKQTKPWYATKKFISAVATVLALGITSVTGLPPAATGWIQGTITEVACEATECEEE